MAFVVRTHRALALTIAVVMAAVGALVLIGPAEAYPGAPWFEPGKPYDDNFPDPSIIRIGSTYYAYGTNTGGVYLPAMSSTDMKTWIARPAYGPLGSIEDPYLNDALPYPAKWAADRPVEGRMTKEVWSPGVAAIGGRYVAYYTVLSDLSTGRYCISVATGSDPLGPFTDNSTGPLVCDADPKGSIDPQPFVDDDGSAWLLWKSEGVPGSQPTKIWIRQLAGDGLSFAAGSSQVELLRTSQAWEGNLVENPSMVRYGGKLYLFYSANEWASASYAIGYAECAGALGPCHKWPYNPLLASRGDRLGPGGPAAFIDAAGILRLGYHWWNAPYTNYPPYPQCEAEGTCETQGQRRLGIARLTVTSSGLQVGVPPPPARDVADSCPPGSVPEDGFVDVAEGTTHEPSVDCAVWWQVARGVAPFVYNPTLAVRRDQMAGFIARTIAESGGSLPAPSDDYFKDDDGSAHEDAINRLAAAGIVSGVSKNSFRPDLPVTREQMATFVVRALDWRAPGSVPSAGEDWFWDDDTSAHQLSIERLAAAGVANGYPGGTYRPSAHVARDQMATFLVRPLDLLVESAGAALPSS